MRASNDPQQREPAPTLDAALRPLDEVLLVVLKIQPSEIADLYMDDYWYWVDAAERELKRQSGTTMES
ncbi:hypothetical protein NDN95_20865 [Burkholderia glumae]|nr:hypothetical protein [Burkholderia glumae]